MILSWGFCSVLQIFIIYKCAGIIDQVIYNVLHGSFSLIEYLLVIGMLFYNK